MLNEYGYLLSIIIHNVYDSITQLLFELIRKMKLFENIFHIYSYRYINIINYNIDNCIGNVFTQYTRVNSKPKVKLS